MASPFSGTVWRGATQGLCRSDQPQAAQRGPDQWGGASWDRTAMVANVSHRSECWGGHTSCLPSVLAGRFSHLTRALTVDRTTLDSRNSGVTRMWKREREAKATEGEKSASLKKLAWPTKVCGQRHE